MRGRFIGLSICMPQYHSGGIYARKRAVAFHVFSRSVSAVKRTQRVSRSSSPHEVCL